MSHNKYIKESKKDIARVSQHPQKFPYFQLPKVNVYEDPHNSGKKASPNG